METEQKIHVQHGFAQVHRLTGGEQFETEAQIIMLVWHANQILPAEQYRQAHFPKKAVDIAVCDDPNKYVSRSSQLDKLGIIYNYR